MHRYEIRYKDQYTRGEWGYCSGEFKNFEECKEWFGLDDCIEYEIVSDTEVPSN